MFRQMTTIDKFKWKKDKNWYTVMYIDESWLERPLIRYEKLSKEDLVDYCRVYWRRIHNDDVLFNEIYKYIEGLKKENKKLKETIKDHQLYEEKLEHRIIELEELLHWELSDLFYILCKIHNGKRIFNCRNIRYEKI